MGPSFIAFPDGRSLLLHDEAAPDLDEVAKFSGRDAERARRLRGLAARASPTCSSPLLLRTPPRLGSHRPGDLLDQLRTAWGLRGLDVRSTAEATRLFTMSIADVLDEWFESPEVKGVLAINGVIGTWAGPEEPGTAYVMMHHTIGDVGDGHLGSWGYPIGGMGAVSDAIRRVGRVVRRRGAHVLTRRAHRRRATAACAASTTATGEELPGAGRRRRHPSADHVPPPDRPAELPADFVARPRALAVALGHRSRSTSRSPSCRTSSPGRAPSRTSASPARSSCATRSTTSSGRSRTPATGGPRQRPFSDGVIPSTLDPTLCPEGTHVMSLFTQWVPASWSRRAAPRGARAVRRPGHRRLHRAGPELQAVGHPPPGHRAVGDGARVRSDRWQHLPW